MQSQFISQPRHKRLIIIFLGWAMDAAPFGGLQRDGYDILAIYDYTGFELSNVRHNAFEDILAICSKYDEIVVMAWSFGVRVATDFLSFCGNLPVTLTVAVNGTPLHIHDTQGIPARIFQGTKANLTEGSFRKFLRRMFTTPIQYSKFVEVMPRRSFDSQKAELDTFGKLAPEGSSQQWDIAIVADSDLIFPTENQLAYWPEHKTVKAPATGHFPDFQKITNTYTIDKKLVATRFTSAGSTYHSSAAVQRSVAEQLWNYAKHAIASTETSNYKKIIEIGAGSGLLTSLYADKFPACNIELWDLTAEHKTPNANIVWVACDAETRICELAPESVDLLLSASTLQWFNSPESFIRRAYNALRPGGIAALAFYSEGTFDTLNRLTGSSLRYPSAIQAVESIPAEAEILISKVESEAIRFDSPSLLLKHLRDTGVNAVGRPTFAGGIQIIRNYPATDNGKYQLVYRPMYLIYKKPYRK